MPRQNAETLKKYIEMISAHSGGVASVIDELDKTPQLEAREGVNRGGMESLGGGPDLTTLARDGLQNIDRGRDPSPEQVSGMEAIILPKLRPAEPVIDGTFTFTHPLWTKLSDDATTRQRLEGVIRSVGRIELPGNPDVPYGGTGFVVGDGLIMTNRHVAAIFTNGLGDRRLSFLPSAKAGIDFKREQGRPTGPTLMVRQIVMVHPYWDMAILKVDNLPATAQPLRLSLQDSRALAGRDIVVIGYPAFDPRNPADVQRDVFGNSYQIKRIQPGKLQGGLSTGSFGKSVLAVTHDCSTLGGNSGSAVGDIDTGEVFGLHFGGVYQQQNFAVPSFELSRDSRVVDAGVVFAGTPSGGQGSWADWWRQADQTEAPANNAGSASAASGGITIISTPHPTPSTQNPEGSVTLEIPLRITVSLGQPGAVAARVTESLADDTTETLREPDHAAEDAPRSGYLPDFLNDSPPKAGLSVPLPTAADPTILARSTSGADVLDYQNFSLRMHAQRRLALLTASNVTKEFALRKPEPDRDYSRKGLSGLGANDQEKWFGDPRLDADKQLPDVFFTKDKGAFDKGHIVRREDVAWGKTYADLKLANGDTYHVTNCSPQVADFNRSTLGVDNWGDLENLVLSEAASERLCVFAGPVLAADDETFVGRGDGGVVLRAKVPKRFWKVIVARVDDGLASYGFVLEQDLSAVPTEFIVTETFKRKMVSLAEIEQVTGVHFDAKLHDIDQFDTLLGAEIAQRGGIKRRANSNTPGP